MEVLKIDGAQLTDQAIEYLDQCRNLKSIMIEFCTNMIGINFYLFQVDYLERIFLIVFFSFSNRIFIILENYVY